MCLNSQGLCKTSSAKCSHIFVIRHCRFDYKGKILFHESHPPCIPEARTKSYEGCYPEGKFPLTFFNYGLSPAKAFLIEDAQNDKTKKSEGEISLTS